jgi:hypothetical protein
MPNKDDPTIATDAAVVGCSKSWVAVVDLVIVDVVRTAPVPLLHTVGICSIDALIFFCCSYLY